MAGGEEIADSQRSPGADRSTGRPDGMGFAQAGRVSGWEVGRCRGEEGLAEISSCLVQTYKECYGKGPIKARTYVMGDLIVSVLQGGLTTADRTLVESGRLQAVVTTREAFEVVVRPRLVEAVEQVVAREVVAFVSGTDPASDSDLFVLELAAGRTGRE